MTKQGAKVQFNRLEGLRPVSRLAKKDIEGRKSGQHGQRPIIEYAVRNHLWQSLLAAGILIDVLPTNQDSFDELKHEFVHRVADEVEEWLEEVS